MKTCLKRIFFTAIVLIVSCFIVTGNTEAQTSPYVSIAGGTFNYDAGTNELSISMGVIGTVNNSNGFAVFPGPPPYGDYMYLGTWTISGLMNGDGAGENWQFVQNSNNGADFTLKDNSGNTRLAAKIWDFTVDKTETSPGSGAFLYEVNAGFDETNVKDFVFSANTPYSQFIDDASKLNNQPWEPMGNLYMSFNFTGAGPNDFTASQSGTLSGTFSVVPEPISSALFVIGGAVFGFRRFVRMKAYRAS